MKPLWSLVLILLPASLLAAEPNGIDSYDRAGHPQCQRRLAMPSNTARYWGDYVGGGALLGGEPRCAHEGTWGWDYSGGIPIKRIWLDWSHQRYQAGGGKYKTDAPTLWR